MGISRYTQPSQSSYIPVDYDMLYKSKLKQQQDYYTFEAARDNVEQFLSTVKAATPEAQAKLEQKKQQYKSIINQNIDKYKDNYTAMLPVMANLNRQIRSDVEGGELFSINKQYQDVEKRKEIIGNLALQGKYKPYQYRAALDNVTNENVIIPAGVDPLKDVYSEIESSATRFKDKGEFKKHVLDWTLANYSDDLNWLQKYGTKEEIEKFDEGLNSAVEMKWMKENPYTGDYGNNPRGGKGKSGGSSSSGGGEDGGYYGTVDLLPEKNEKNKVTESISNAVFDSNGRLIPGETEDTLLSNWRSIKRDIVGGVEDIAEDVTGSRPGWVNAMDKRAKEDAISASELIVKGRGLIPGQEKMSDKKISDYISSATNASSRIIGEVETRPFKAEEEQAINGSLPNKAIYARGLDTDGTLDSLLDEAGIDKDNPDEVNKFINSIQWYGIAQETNYFPNAIVGTVAIKDKGPITLFVEPYNEELAMSQYYWQVAQSIIDPVQAVDKETIVPFGPGQQFVVEKSINPKTKQFEGRVSLYRLDPRDNKWKTSDDDSGWSLSEFKNKYYR